MARFSERYGYREVRTALQHEEMDQNLRVDLWNVVHFYADRASDYTERFTPYLRIWLNQWHKPADNLPYHTSEMSAGVKQFILADAWYDVLDLLEMFVTGFEPHERSDMHELFNTMFERNLSAYRFVGDLVIEMNQSTDVEAIEQALEDAADITGARRHLDQAISLLADRDNPDYANSIKESISAVEAVCQHVTGNHKATLGDGIKALKNSGVTIHPALEKSWLAAYGYSSDADGIRHALQGESTVDQARARYWLVTCSAFVSLLLSQAATVGLLGKRDD